MYECMCHCSYTLKIKDRPYALTVHTAVLIEHAGENLAMSK